MLEHFGPSLKSPWTRLEAPELTDDLREAVIAGVDDAEERSVNDLIIERDAAIIAVRTVIDEIKARR